MSGEVNADGAAPGDGQRLGPARVDPVQLRAAVEAVHEQYGTLAGKRVDGQLWSGHGLSLSGWTNSRNLWVGVSRGHLIIT